MSTLTEPTHPANGTGVTAKNERPHRRLSLTRPTLPSTMSTAELLDVATPANESTPIESLPIKNTPESVPAGAAATPAPKPAKKRVADTPSQNGTPQSTHQAATDTAAPVVRVMAYLSTPEAALLDDLWMQFRRSPQKPSKSDILRAALTLASTRPEELTVTLSQQQTNTLSRQRLSKSKNPAD